MYTNTLDLEKVNIKLCWMTGFSSANINKLLALTNKIPPTTTHKSGVQLSTSTNKVQS